ncbi:hypothetical protein AGMMS49532_09200 [Endomicrobiia bacterium]|nr:hypothetical protein AGMMS49532_09200 [Endomicrobiia bacterium]
MNFNKFKEILNEEVFERSKSDLLEKISDKPERYVGLFRPTKPKAKILQNLLQSQEIKFGDAFEKLIESYLIENGFIILPKKISGEKVNESLIIDQYFKIKEKIYFIEQKIRDDHDSTKKRGQIENFKKKLIAVKKIYKDNEITGIIYFVDPDLMKNKNYYKKELISLSEYYKINTYLFYGKDIFSYLKVPYIWDEIVEHLKSWKTVVPGLPEVNFDLTPEVVFNEIKDLSVAVFRKLLSNDEVYNQILLTLFPEGKTLRLLLNYFKNKKLPIYLKLSELLEKRLR